MLILKTLERMKVIVFDKTKLKFLISCREKDNKYEKNIKKVIFFCRFQKAELQSVCSNEQYVHFLRIITIQG